MPPDDDMPARLAFYRRGRGRQPLPPVNPRVLEIALLLAKRRAILDDAIESAGNGPDGDTIGGTTR